jgi:hypothetical protein
MLTYSMEQSPFREANRFAASQDIPSYFLTIQLTIPYTR